MIKNLVFEGLTAGLQGRSLDQLHAAGRILGSAMWHALPTRRKLAQDAIAFHLGLESSKARALARKNFRHIGCSYMEIFASRKVDYRFLNEHVHLPEPALFRRIWEQPRPIVAATAHFGAWELLAGILRLNVAGRKAQIVIQHLKDQTLMDHQARLRSRKGIDIIHNKQRGSDLHRNLKRNGLCAFLVDHNCGRRKALFLPFLNKKAAVNKGPAQLAVFAEALVWPIFFLRVPNKGYRIISRPPLDVAQLSGTKNDKVTHVTSFYTRAVEDMILAHPEQWYWIHKRWKTRPPEENPKTPSPAS